MQRGGSRRRPIVVATSGVHTMHCAAPLYLRLRNITDRLFLVERTFVFTTNRDFEKIATAGLYIARSSSLTAFLVEIRAFSVCNALNGYWPF